MLILDTNVVSELMRVVPNDAVPTWLDGQASQLVWTTAITVMELHHGIQAMLPGRRQTALKEALHRLTSEKLGKRIAPFDDAAARITAVVAVERQRRGQPGELRDTMIAGIVVATGASFATRNTRHFNDLSITLINPWTV